MVLKHVDSRLSTRRNRKAANLLSEASRSDDGRAVLNMSLSAPFDSAHLFDKYQNPTAPASAVSSMRGAKISGFLNRRLSNQRPCVIAGMGVKVAMKLLPSSAL